MKQSMLSSCRKQAAFDKGGKRTEFVPMHSPVLNITNPRWASGTGSARSCNLQHGMKDSFTLADGVTLKLRPVTRDDDSFLLSVYASTRAEELAQVQWQPGQQESFVKWQFERQRDDYNARFPDAEYDVILIDDRPSGRIWIGRSNEEIRLLDIALLAEFQKRGAGTLLVRS